MAWTNDLQRTSFTAVMILAFSAAGCGVEKTVKTDGQEDAVDERDQTAVVKLSPKLLEAGELADGWISLFDGQTLFGWQSHAEANWRVEEGAIVVDQGDAGLLCTTTQFSDYVLKLEFRADAKTNSGVFLRTLPEITRGQVTTECYELNIAPKDNPFPTGSLVARKKVEGDHNGDGWQQFVVTVEGDRIHVQLDGKEVLDYVDSKPIGRGLIGLQHNSGRVAFRNIKLKPLGVSSIFNGKDLTGWKEGTDSISKFTVNDQGHLNVKDGKGWLETKNAYGDFVIQLECISHAENLNSGIFFRCIPGQAMNGYESQIHNGFKDGDRTSPIDCGSGGIFRRQNARYVVADDLTWFHKTIVADGPHMAVWINGYQVSDWTDGREPDENPRRGLRVEPGTFQIQGHDPTTNLSFRNLRAGELVKRK